MEDREDEARSFQSGRHIVIGVKNEGFYFAVQTGGKKRLWDWRTGASHNLIVVVLELDS